MATSEKEISKKIDTINLFAKESKRDCGASLDMIFEERDPKTGHNIEGTCTVIFDGDGEAIADINKKGVNYQVLFKTLSIEEKERFVNITLIFIRGDYSDHVKAYEKLEKSLRT